MLLVAVLLLMGAAAAMPGDPEALPPNPWKLAYAPLNWTVPLGSPYRDSLPNGLRAYVAVDSELPLIQVIAYFKWGTLLDPLGKEGASMLMGRLMRTGGAGNYDPDSLEALIDQYAMNFRVSASEDQLEFSASFLSDFADTGFAVMRQMLFSPRFDLKKLDQEKKNSEESVRHEFDNPGPTLNVAYRKAMYAETPAARIVTEQSLAAVERRDLIELHGRAIQTANVIVCVAGKFDRAAMLSRLARLFPPAGPAAAVVFPAMTVRPALKCLVVNKPISQVYVRFGVPLFQRPNPDYYPASLAAFILGGGGFTSRLGTRVRSNAGLTYSIHSAAESNYTFPATWYVDFFTKSPSFGQAMALSLSVIREVRANGITDSELANARETMIGGLPSMFRTPFDIVSTYGWNEYYGRSPLQYRNYANDLRAVTKADVGRAFDSYFDPAACTYAVVGDTAALRQYGKAEGFSLETLTPQKTIPPDSLERLR